MSSREPLLVSRSSPRLLKSVLSTSGRPESPEASSPRGEAVEESTGFAADSVSDDGALESVVILELLEYLTTDVERRLHLSELPFYLVFMAVLTSEVILLDLPHTTFSDNYLLTQRIRSIYNHQELARVETQDDVWKWMNQSVASIWEARSYGTGESPPSESCDTRNHDKAISLGMIVLRQYRVDPSACPFSGGHRVVPPAERGYLPCGCYGEYSPKRLSDDPYGPGGRWIPNKKKTFPIVSGFIQSSRLLYDEPQKEFTEALPLDTSLEVLLNHTTSLKNDGWIDWQTRLVSVDSIFFNVGNGYFAKAACYVELFGAGKLHGACSIRTFKMTAFDTNKERFIFALEIMVLLLTLTFFLFLCRTTWMRLRLRPFSFPLTAGDVFEIAKLVMIGWSYSLRLSLWAQSLSMQSNSFYLNTDVLPAQLMYNTMADYAVNSGLCLKGIAASTVMLYVGMLRYLRHISNFSMVSDTTRRAIVDILRLVTILMFVLCGYGLAGTLLYATDLESFETFIGAVGWLVRVLLLGGEGEFDWSSLHASQPVWTAFYIGSFYFLCFFLLLNMIMAVIVASFQHVQAALEKAQVAKQHRWEKELDEELDLKVAQYDGLGKGRVLRRDQAHPFVLRMGHMLRRAYADVSLIVKKLTDVKQNDKREEALRVVKDHCCNTLRLPLTCLEQTPDYYSRLRIDLPELTRIAGNLLPNEDLEHIMEGTMERGMQQENLAVVLEERFKHLTSLIARVLDELSNTRGTHTNIHSEVMALRDNLTKPWKGVKRHHDDSEKRLSLWREAGRRLFGLSKDQVSGLSYDEEEALIKEGLQRYKEAMKTSNTLRNGAVSEGEGTKMTLKLPAELQDHVLPRKASLEAKHEVTISPDLRVSGSLTACERVRQELEDALQQQIAVQPAVDKEDLSSSPPASNVHYHRVVKYNMAEEAPSSAMSAHLSRVRTFHSCDDPPAAPPRRRARPPPLSTQPTNE